MNIDGGSHRKRKEIYRSGCVKSTGGRGADQAYSTPGESCRLYKVKPSKQVNRVVSILSAIERIPVVRENKVKTIRDAIAAGTYMIDPRKIAQKMLNEL